MQNILLIEFSIKQAKEAEIPTESCFDNKIESIISI